ncbi:GNAT family N-acetyltransferase [Tenacibaculum sp.]|uniref:GNAT family N-acetyltransferase n=1 Tax=Tenacibaculum sp. TaxID=1906242 RepID=UPI003D11B564
MTHTQLNIDNLTSLWRTASSVYKGHQKEDSFEIAYIENTQWPSRVWTDSITSSQQIEELQQKLDAYGNLTFSYFTPFNQENTDKNELPLNLKSVQYGMSLLLKEKFTTQKNITFKRVENEEEANTWSHSFDKAFGYKISPKTIFDTREHIPFYLVYFEQELIGTIILYATDSVAGLHSLGILPEKRKQGFATEIMCHTLNKAIDNNLSLATLQASEMAKEMYLKLGFSLDFLMKNYGIANPS